MSVEEAILADPFVSTVTDEEIELRALCGALSLAGGFSLLFARCNQADHRRDLIDKIKSRLPNLDILVIDLRKPITHLLDELRNRLGKPLPDALFVLGLENSLPTSRGAESSPFIANLNASRNSFPQALPFPVVLWVSDYVVAAIARGAPDFFSIRSGLYSFAAAPTQTIGMARSLMSGDWVAARNLSREEKRERIESIRSLLADYESLPTEKRDLSTEASLHSRLAALLHAIGLNDEAMAEARASLGLDEQCGDRAVVASSLHQIGIIHQARGEYGKALEKYEQSRRIAEELGDRAGVAISRGQIGKLFTQLGRYPEAFQNLLSTLSTFVELQSPNARVVINMLRDLRAQWSEKDFDAAWQQATGEDVPDWIEQPKS